jgi:dihydroorotase-like cyclic amidohydrolase
MNVDNNVFEGMSIKGRPRYVFSRGRKVADGNTFLGAKGAGKHIKSARFFPVAL